MYMEKQGVLDAGHPVFIDKRFNEIEYRSIFVADYLFSEHGY
ncbi:hypothetical protein AT864_00064 [Anoxybacillus sp. P3H1B]|nr:hypothetical protein AT864_00064 [Anoxybacillus sp. P3H1B]MBB3906558.1 hypothetical protein [Anoxybacillus rupiensis]